MARKNRTPESQREYRARHPEKAAEYRRRKNVKNKARRRSDPEFRESERRTIDASRLLKQYGITVAQRDKMLDGQGGVCAVCGRPETRATMLGQPRKLAVDHCHETGRVRGLLCLDCNGLLGFIERVRRLDAETLSRFAAYLARNAG